MYEPSFGVVSGGDMYWVGSNIYLCEVLDIINGLLIFYPLFVD